MTNERNRETATTPDSRAEYAEIEARAEEESDEIDESPAPYDQARPGTHPDKVIVKGEREKPGPTAEEIAQHERGGDNTGDLGGNDLHRRINNETNIDHDDVDVLDESDESA